MIKIKLSNKQSIYLDVADKIEGLINAGIYKVDERLPSCRNLALELGINPNTIERAYSILEEKGIVYTIPKKGIYVKKITTDEHLKDEFLKMATHFKDEGLEKSEMIESITKLFEEEKTDD